MCDSGKSINESQVVCDIIGGRLLRRQREVGSDEAPSDEQIATRISR